MRDSLRRAVEHGALVADQATGSFRFRRERLAHLEAKLGVRTTGDAVARALRESA